jgi:hypothetical protein
MSDSSSTDKVFFVNLNSIPELKDDGSNWWDFYRRLEETLTMSGFSDTMDKSNEPSLEPAPPALASSATAAQQAAYTTAQTNWQTKKVEYDRTLANWNERSRRAYMAIRSKCAFNNFKKVEHLTRVYEMIDVLRAGCEMGSEKLMELTTRFYGLHCSDCENIADFSGQLSQINHTLRDFHPDTAFSEVQLILRFLQGLGSAYDTWINTLTQSSVLIATPTSPTITFDAVCQKAYDEEKRQAAMTGSNTALVAHSQSRSSKSGSGPVCTHCKKA